jgi:hypothetical protein
MAWLKADTDKAKNLTSGARNSPAFRVRVNGLENEEGEYELHFEHADDIVARRFSGVNKIHVPEDYVGVLNVAIDVFRNTDKYPLTETGVREFDVSISLLDDGEELDTCTVTCTI